jgi:hypothetical protein
VGPGAVLYEELVLVAGFETCAEADVCAHCFSAVSARAQCTLCGEVPYCDAECAAAAWPQHCHLCPSHVLQGATPEETSRRREALRQLLSIGGPHMCTALVVANTCARAVSAQSSMQEAWGAHFGHLDCGTSKWTGMLPGEEAGAQRRAMLDATCAVLDDIFMPRAGAQHSALRLPSFLHRANMDIVMAQVALNITQGYAEAGRQVEIWALAAVHAATNHCCPPRVRGRKGPNVHPEFVPSGAVGLRHRCVADRAIATEEELTLCYDTVTTAQEGGFDNLRSCLKQRRHFDCRCSTCEGS